MPTRQLPATSTNAVVRPGGLIMVDNAFAFGQLFEETPTKDGVWAIGPSMTVHRRDDLTSIIGAIGDGMWICVPMTGNCRATTPKAGQNTMRAKPLNDKSTKNCKTSTYTKISLAWPVLKQPDYVPDPFSSLMMITCCWIPSAKWSVISAATPAPATVA